MLLLRRKFANILNINTHTNWIPVSAAAVLGLISLASGFNGLYGQDAHEYLRLGRAYFEWLHGGVWPQGYSELAGGYPFAAALLRFVVRDPILALQMVSWVSAGLSLWLFDALLRQLTPGAYASSRRANTALLLGLAPFFVRASATVMSDAFGLMLVLATLLNGLRALEDSRGRHALAAAFLGALAIFTRFSSIALLLPLALTMAWALMARGRWLLFLGSILAGAIGLLPLVFMLGQAEGGLLHHSMFQDWSLWNIFHRSFNTINGAQVYLLPNGLYALLYPFVYPGFFMLLPALFMLAKKTDLHLPTKRILLACLVAHLCLLMTVAGQNPRHLLPDYVLLLLLMFPAWDRFYAYGFYFFKRLITGLLALGLTVQLVFTAYFMYPVAQRFRLEKSVAAAVQKAVPPDATIYGFDLDISLKSYLPEAHILNLWEKRYPVFQPDAFVLFNAPKLRAQWAGQNPMLNWEELEQYYDLEEVVKMKDGWVLYRIVK